MNLQSDERTFFASVQELLFLPVKMTEMNWIVHCLFVSVIGVIFFLLFLLRLMSE